ncbi:MAG: xanthine dehydrogenase family protein molybdopterin-binding subunit [Caulobacteraceae bacterium]|nr:xanthine dehydrogenase family protein molybdopterin-binding subunit [Caulobacteraceae bacterium]
MIGASGPAARIGEPALRIDGPAKVSGAARYPADEPFAHAAYAVLVTSAIARGRILSIDLAQARGLEGVLDILTHENVGGEAKPPPPPGGHGEATTTLESDRIWHDGQIIAVVVAESLEAAEEAARRVRVAYASEAPSAGFDSPGAQIQLVKEAEPSHEDVRVGDPEGAFQTAPVKVEARYSTPIQHHNPMELFATTCAWEDARLTVLEPTQYVHGLRAALAMQLGLDPAKIRVVSKFVGGAFGSKGAPSSRTAWIAIAARRLRRPVKLVARRDQGFTIATHRAETRHHVKLAASRDGRLLAVVHEGQEVTSRPTPYNVSGNKTTAMLYGSPNIATKVEIVRADRNTPGFMRAPPETPYMFALESAMDELALALAIDPVQLRKLNDAAIEPVKRRPYTSRNLVACLERAAETFGWARRDPAPGSMRDGDWLIGWGCAAAAYPANIGAATARLRLSADGAARIELAAIDIGTGSYTILAQVAADRLGLPIDKIQVDIGDSDLPAAGLAAGSNHAAAISNVVARACETARMRIAAAATAPGTPFSGTDPAKLALRDGTLVGPDGRREPLGEALSRVSGGVLEIFQENNPAGAPSDGVRKVEHGQMAMARGSDLEDRAAYGFGAQFVEVRVHRRTAEIRVPRAVGAFAAGAILNPLTARSQLMGGMIWGISAALFEATEIDRRTARYVNTNLADYLTPVNADVGAVEVILVPETDRLCNPLGVKGVGELGIVGMNAAVANAVAHATGRRIRDLPIRIEQLL